MVHTTLQLAHSTNTVQAEGQEPRPAPRTSAGHSPNQGAIKQGSQVYRTLVELSPDAIVLVTPDGKIVLANAQAAAAQGFAAVSELVGRNLFELVAHDEHQRALEHLSRAVELGSIRNIEHHLLRADGTGFPAELSIAVIADTTGQPQAFIVIVRDITERKLSKERIERLLGDVQRSNEELMLAYDATLEGWSAAVDLRDRETRGHSRRVTTLTLRLARAMGLSAEALVQIRRGALLHDIGKMGIPDAILLKPGSLNDEEWEIMRMHPAYANELLGPIAFLHPALSIPYCHHEKWDGTGYPGGLQGEEIPLPARLFAVVDVYHALRSDRPYRAGWPEERVREYIRAEAGTHFDPEVVRVFLALPEVEDYLY